MGLNIWENCQRVLPSTPLALYIEDRSSMAVKNRDAHGDSSGVRDGVVVKALRYKPAGRGFDSRCCHWKFSVA